MSSDLESSIIRDFAEDIADKLKEAAIIAQTASGLGGQGLPDRAFAAMLDIETLIHDASILLNAMSVVRRRGRETTMG